MEENFSQRETVYYAGSDENHPETAFERFKRETGNELFRYQGFLTTFSLLILLVLYPAASLYNGGQDPTQLLKSLDQFMIMVLLIVTVIFQWGIFLVNYLSVWLEKTGLRGIGLTKIRGIDFAWTIAFLLGAFVVMVGLEWFMGQVGIPINGDVGLLIPKDFWGRIVWVCVAATAGFCEEVAFRGYIMTRLRLIGRLNSWTIPVIVSSVVFGACHAYQGLPGFIAISIFGAMFALLYIRTGSLWPCIFAHFLWDFGALFYPK
ncbi:MAG: CPBP family intramembrane glutamic endopeptidase [Candidatus Zixiibacteriota bacterium]